jgi:hypothetical protein
MNMEMNKKYKVTVTTFQKQRHPEGGNQNKHNRQVAVYGKEHRRINMKEKEGTKNNFALLLQGTSCVTTRMTFTVPTGRRTKTSNKNNGSLLPTMKTSPKLTD